jgi:hypothetical protein
MPKLTGAWLFCVVVGVVVVGWEVVGCVVVVVGLVVLACVVVVGLIVCGFVVGSSLSQAMAVKLKAARSANIRICFIMDLHFICGDGTSRYSDYIHYSAYSYRIKGLF